MGLSKEPKYSRVGYSSDLSSEEGGDFEKSQQFRAPQKQMSAFHRTTMIAVRAVGLVLILALLVELWHYFNVIEQRLGNIGRTEFNMNEMTCTNPTVRKSWRSLSDDEKIEYTSAVACLMKKPSYMNGNSSIHDDFTYIHMTSGSQTHFSAAALPWHRIHLHMFETMLREECDYSGHLVYWDWEIDENPLRDTDVFDPVVGFGGDGEGLIEWENPTGVFDYTQCVRDGPFAFYEPQWWGTFVEGASLQGINNTFTPHCLTRSFTDEFKDPNGAPGSFAPMQFDQKSINEIIAIERYEEFCDKVEAMHFWLPFAVRGDYLSLAATNDPTFYLHLSNIDRLWWQWQQKDGGSHYKEYNGKTRKDSLVPASLQDPLPLPRYPGLPRDKEILRVEDMMDTESGFLCYRY